MIRIFLLGMLFLEFTFKKPKPKNAFLNGINFPIQETICDRLIADYRIIFLFINSLKVK